MDLVNFWSEIKIDRTGALDYLSLIDDGKKDDLDHNKEELDRLDYSRDVAHFTFEFKYFQSIKICFCIIFIIGRE